MTENRSFELRAEAFNVFNMRSFRPASVEGNISSEHSASGEHHAAAADADGGKVPVLGAVL